MTIPSYRILGIKPDDIEQSFHPEHWKDLKNSRLSNQTIYDSRIFSVNPADFIFLLKSALPGVISALAFPYFLNNGKLDPFNYMRFKLFPPLLDKDGKKRKYHQVFETGNQAYFPPSFFNRFEEGQEVFIVEGEKKSLALHEMECCAIGIPGCSSWREKLTGHLLLGIDGLDLRKRKVTVIMDSDYNTNHNIKTQMDNFMDDLSKKGAVVSRSIAGVLG